MFWQDADHDVCFVVEPQRRAGNIAAAVEEHLPEPMTEHALGRSRRRLVRTRASEDRCDPEDAKQVRRRGAHATV
jgi:hypothetical protein